MPTMLAIGIDRIGTALPAVPIFQIGGSRIGMPCIPRDKTGRFVRMSAIAEAHVALEAPVEQEQEQESKVPQRVRTHPLIKLIAILCVLAACGAWRMPLPYACCLLQVSGPSMKDDLLRIAKFTPSEFLLDYQSPFGEGRWRELRRDPIPALASLGNSPRNSY